MPHSQEFLPRLAELPPLQQAQLLFFTAVQWLHAASEENRLKPAVEALAAVRGGPWLLEDAGDGLNWWIEFTPPLVEFFGVAEHPMHMMFTFNEYNTEGFFYANDADDELTISKIELMEDDQHHLCWDVLCGYFRRSPFVLSSFVHGVLPLLRFMQDHFPVMFPCMSALCETDADLTFLRDALAAPDMPRISHLWI